MMDEGVKELPTWLSNMVAREEVEVLWVENTGPYRKLIPVYRLSTDSDWIVTCDDDVIYGPKWLASLVETAEIHPGSIICGRARRPIKNCFGIRQSYVMWPLAAPGASGKDLVPTGVSGVLYRNSLLDKETMLNDDFKVLAPRQDDLWFHLARKIADVEVVVSSEAGKYVYPIEAPGALSTTNLASRVVGWDSFFKALFDRLFFKAKGYCGYSVCDNDISIKRIDQYKKSIIF